MDWGIGDSMVFVGCIHPFVGNEWWSWVHGMHGGNEFGDLLGAPWVGTHCAQLLLMEHIWAQNIGLVRYWAMVHSAEEMTNELLSLGGIMRSHVLGNVWVIN